MNPLIEKLVASFDTNTKGFSARKLSAFAGVLISGWVTVKWALSCSKSEQWSLLPEVLGVWLFFVSVCLGLTTWEKKFNAGKTEKNEAQ